MKHNGITITPQQEAAIVAAMVGSFKFSDIRKAAFTAGVGRDMVDGKVAWTDRVADRFLQRERRAGRVRFLGQRNGWVQNTDAKL